jgi:hypothetical protein
LTINSLSDYVYNHVSPLYWVGLSLTLASLFLLGITTKSYLWKWVIAVSLVTAMFSISYFYYLIPGSDSQSFRGLNEYYISTSRVPTEPHHTYYEWPQFFMLSNLVTSIAGLPLAMFEFILYALIGFLFTSALYTYFAKFSKNGAFMAVGCFFLGMYYFLNYQSVPFSLAFALFLILLMMGDRIFDSRATSFVAVLLFCAVTLCHAFVPLFFVLYELVWYILNRKSDYLKMFSLTLTIYVAVQLFQAPLSLVDRIRVFLYALSSEYGQIAQATLTPATAQFDVFAQLISRSVVICAVIISIAGFLIILTKRRLKDHEKVIFISGALYSALGAAFQVLGSRAFPLLFIPVSLGACYVLETRFKQFLKVFMLILFILFPFILIHVSFDDSQIMFQTKEGYVADNFMLDHYNWNLTSLVLAHTRVTTYLVARENGRAFFESDFSSNFPRISAYDAILYTVGLGKHLVKYNYTTASILSEAMMNVLYDDGQSYIAVKSYNVSWAMVFG